jgi:hypothetical protein
MILYNMRERGPYEYDKFVLNILQIYNSINLAELSELDANKTETNTLQLIANEIDKYYNEILSLSEQINTELLKRKGGVL